MWRVVVVVVLILVLVGAKPVSKPELRLFLLSSFSKESENSDYLYAALSELEATYTVRMRSFYYDEFYKASTSDVQVVTDRVVGSLEKFSPNFVLLNGDFAMEQYALRAGNNIAKYKTIAWGTYMPPATWSTWLATKSLVYIPIAMDFAKVAERIKIAYRGSSPRFVMLASNDPMSLFVTNWLRQQTQNFEEIEFESVQKAMAFVRRKVPKNTVFVYNLFRLQSTESGSTFNTQAIVGELTSVKHANLEVMIAPSDSNWHAGIGLSFGQNQSEIRAIIIRQISKFVPGVVALPNAIGVNVSRLNRLGFHEFSNTLDSVDILHYE